MDKKMLKEACDNIGMAPEHRGVMLDWYELVTVECQRLASAEDAADKKSLKKEGV